MFDPETSAGIGAAIMGLIWALTDFVRRKRRQLSERPPPKRNSSLRPPRR